ncbi:ETS-like protein pointed, isoform P2 [Harpegnathos saltator]|uniref:ETS-like protein pointed, isoform P2 n=1 Tax=Harpegnathos saltator TaxID=610380 RepID=E2B8A7_HARSA|nr:ETS-like protein pointed, isoform P2 [Harpegnathos saltator]
MTEALEASFASWEKERLRLNITKDPRQWSEAAVAHWLHWAIGEFSLEGVAVQPWQHMTGKQICAMGKESFLARAPAFMGDILWEHLEILQKDVDAAKASLENVPANLYESVCVPDLGDFLGYQGGHQVAASEHKNPPTPAGSTASNNSSGPPQSATQQPPIQQPSSGAVSLPSSRQYHNDVKAKGVEYMKKPTHMHRIAYQCVARRILDDVDGNDGGSRLSIRVLSPECVTRPRRIYAAGERRRALAKNTLEKEGRSRVIAAAAGRADDMQSRGACDNKRNGES